MLEKDRYVRYINERLDFAFVIIIANLIIWGVINTIVTKFCASNVGLNVWLCLIPFTFIPAFVCVYYSLWYIFHLFFRTRLFEVTKDINVEHCKRYYFEELPKENGTYTLTIVKIPFFRNYVVKYDRKELV